jgi:hypothetical protein
MDIPAPLTHLGPTSEKRKEWKKDELHNMKELREAQR